MHLSLTIPTLADIQQASLIYLLRQVPSPRPSSQILKWFMQSGLKFVCKKLKVPAKALPQEFWEMPGIPSTFYPSSLTLCSWDSQEIQSTTKSRSLKLLRWWLMWLTCRPRPIDSRESIRQIGFTFHALPSRLSNLNQLAQFFHIYERTGGIGRTEANSQMGQKFFCRDVLYS